MGVFVAALVVSCDLPTLLSAQRQKYFEGYIERRQTARYGERKRSGYLSIVLLIDIQIAYAPRTAPIFLRSLYIRASGPHPSRPLRPGRRLAGCRREFHWPAAP